MVSGFNHLEVYAENPSVGNRVVLDYNIINQMLSNKKPIKLTIKSNGTSFNEISLTCEYVDYDRIKFFTAAYPLADIIVMISIVDNTAFLSFE